MNNYYTLIYLIREWNDSLTGSRFGEAMSVKRNTLDLYLNDRNSGIRITFCSDPQKTALFSDRYQPPRRNNAASFFSVLEGQVLERVTLAEFDRFVTFHFSDDFRLVFLLYSNRANVFLIKADEVLETFKKVPQEALQFPPQPRAAAPVSLNNVTQYSPGEDPFKWMMRVDPLLPRGIARAFLTHLASNSSPTDLIAPSILELIRIIRSQSHPHFSPDYGFSLLPPTLLGSSSVKTFQSVNDAVAYSFYQAVRNADFTSVKANMLTRLQQFYNRLGRSVEELDQLDKSLEKADHFEQTGHLLMGCPQCDTASGQVDVPDFYDHGNLRKIVVSADLDMVRNAERYYERARSARKTFASAKVRLEQIQHRRTLTQTLLDELENIQFPRDLDKWTARNEDVIRMLGIQGSGDDPTALPYKRYMIDKYEIRVGKSAQNNDELLRISHKEDVWLHARGVAGSHVIIPMKRSTAFPPRSILEFAAEMAAFFSKGKGSSLLPVIFTKKKFVRKPKGAAPGSVRVDKEEVLLVEPRIPTRAISDMT
jgi:predicted ribosome quality control (RQC) complex YloA/Tae2 family protein